ncbi:MAG: hypothetical protein JWO63_1131 [Frankiales bacterium]|nr:hypothetical protein [Frankiales bacterium]
MSRTSTGQLHLSTAELAGNRAPLEPRINAAVQDPPKRASTRHERMVSRDGFLNFSARR